jgi:hypothetical protein
VKPVIQIWVKEDSLEMIKRGQFPSSWWRTYDQVPSDHEAIVVCTNVTYDWFVQMRDAEKELEKKNDLPF